MFECKSKAEARMMAIPMFDITELLANGNSFEADQSHTSQKGTIQADGLNIAMHWMKMVAQVHWWRVSG